MFNVEEEEQLAEYVVKMVDMGFGLTRAAYSISSS